MKNKPAKTKMNKDEIREIMHLTRPPRLEGVVKEAMMRPVRKKKKKEDGKEKK